MEMKKMGINQGKRQEGLRNSFLKSICVGTLLLVFTVLLVGGFWIFKSEAPRPLVVTENGEVLFTKDSIKGGQAVFQKYALMDYGSVLGNGSYMGPDYTAEALKIYTEGMHEFYAQKNENTPFKNLTAAEKIVIRERVKEEMRHNRYHKNKDTLVLTEAQVYGLQQVRSYYHEVFTKGDGWGLQGKLIKEKDLPGTNRAWVAKGDQITQVADSSSGLRGYRVPTVQAIKFPLLITGLIMKTRGM
jgi:nitric oxide reductase subunit B